MRDNGVVSPQLSSYFFPPLQPVINTEFIYIPKFRDKSFLLQKYVEEGLSISEIASICFSTRCAVRNGLTKHGITIKSQKELGKNKSQLRFGEAYRKRQVVDHKRELEAIEKMKQLREQGFSYWKIADVLNTMKIPTKTRRGQWHARSVQKVLDSAA